MSRSAYREAVQVLSAKGLVESRPKTGTRVLPRNRWNLLDPDVLAWAFSGEPDIHFVRSLFELRAIVEPAAARLAAERRDKVDLKEMRDALADFKGGKIVVMINPGHGGKDPGATGPTGLREKDVVLAIARMVREKLARVPGFHVHMTRDADLFIPLEERTAMANEAGADIFVSLHINASRNRNAEGISTYVLSRASDQEALELAARENGVSVQRLSEVRFIIDDLSTYGRKKESLKLAKTVNDAIVRNISSRHGSVNDLGLKQAPFYVLVGARMTAVLVEASFISNRSEESRLRQRPYLETIADSVVEAVRYYGENGALARAS